MFISHMQIPISKSNTNLIAIAVTYYIKLGARGVMWIFQGVMATILAGPHVLKIDWQVIDWVLLTRIIERRKFIDAYTKASRILLLQ